MRGSGGCGSRGDGSGERLKWATAAGDSSAGTNGATKGESGEGESGEGECLLLPVMLSPRGPQAGVAAGWCGYA